MLLTSTIWLSANSQRCCHHAPLARGVYRNDEAITSGESMSNRFEIVSHNGARHSRRIIAAIYVPSTGMLGAGYSVLMRVRLRLHVLDHYSLAEGIGHNKRQLFSGETSAQFGNEIPNKNTNMNNRRAAIGRSPSRKRVRHTPGVIQLTG